MNAIAKTRAGDHFYSNVVVIVVVAIVVVVVVIVVDRCEIGVIIIHLSASNRNVCQSQLQNVLLFEFYCPQYFIECALQYIYCFIQTTDCWLCVTDRQVQQAQKLTS